ncbi:MAG: alpha/beta hydrolase [Anaerolineales bacterium]|nr:alpha/beta hydrolase [Anaerolineales bacterium]
MYNALYLNPDTFEVFIDLSYSDAIYYGVTCRDYAEPGNTPQEQAANFIKEGDEIDTSLPRLASVFYGDLPCTYWPYPQDDSHPAPFAEPFRGEGFPTLVLNATTDPATPYSGAQSVYSNLTDGYLVTEVGGPHVIFSWGLECVDSLVTDFLVQDKMPAQRETLCEGVVADEFVPLAPANAADYADLLEAFTAVDNEINYLPEYYYISSTTARAIACPYGGTFAFDSGDTGDHYIFTNCAFSNGFAMTGGGEYNAGDGSFMLEVDVTGLRDGSLTYTRDNEGSLHVSGTYGGGTGDLSE